MIKMNLAFYFPNKHINQKFYTNSGIKQLYSNASKHNFNNFVTTVTMKLNGNTLL